MSISIQEAKKLIKNGAEYSDAEVETIIHDLQSMAELIYDDWSEKKKAK